MLGPPSNVHSSGLDPVLESDSESLSSLTTRRGPPLLLLSEGPEQRLGRDPTASQGRSPLAFIGRWSSSFAWMLLGAGNSLPPQAV